MNVPVDVSDRKLAEAALRATDVANSYAPQASRGMLSELDSGWPSVSP